MNVGKLPTGPIDLDTGMGLSPVTEVQRLELKPGDRIVLRTGTRLSMHEADILRSRISAWLPPGVKILILDQGMTLEVAGPS